jgi:hypothetical protein
VGIFQLMKIFVENLIEMDANTKLAANEKETQRRTREQQKLIYSFGLQSLTGRGRLWFPQAFDLNCASKERKPKVEQNPSDARTRRTTNCHV